MESNQTPEGHHGTWPAPSEFRPGELDSVMYDVCVYEHPDEPGNWYYVSRHGVMVGPCVVSVVNGSVCVNPIDGVPDAINFGYYIGEVLDRALASVGPVVPVMAVFDPDLLRYRPA